MIFRKTFQ